MHLRMPRIWEILKDFKDLCKAKGWRISETEDWIAIGEEYHNFLCARNVTPHSFERIASGHKCVVREELSYLVTEAAYTAWLFSETPSTDLVRVFSENPEFAKKIALYDLSPLMEGKNLCLKLNQTDSPVFQQFEDFLEKEFKATLEPMLEPEVASGNFTLLEPA